MADRDNQCAHEACVCPVGEDQEYCSTYCQTADEEDVTEIACQCGHPPCE